MSEIQSNDLSLDELHQARNFLHKGILNGLILLQEDLDRFLQYLLFEKKNEPAAGNILDDFGDTLNCLKNVAGSLSLCENQRLRALGYHRINFLRHRYFMLYRIEENTVFIDDIFHELQDYENKMK